MLLTLYQPFQGLGSEKQKIFNFIGPQQSAGQFSSPVPTMIQPNPSQASGTSMQGARPFGTDLSMVGGPQMATSNYVGGGDRHS